MPGESRETGDQVKVGCRRRAAGDGPPRGGRAGQPPFLGPWTNSRPGGAWPGAKGAGPTRGKGQPYKAVPHREPRSNKGEAGSPGGDLPRADGTLSHSGDPGHRGRGRWQATAKGGDHPTRRGLAGHRSPFQGSAGRAWGTPVSIRGTLSSAGSPGGRGVPKGVRGVPCPSEYGGVKQAGGAGRVLYEGGFPAH